MSTYIHFTEEQKQRAASVDLEEFLRCRGEKLLASGREKRLARDHIQHEHGRKFHAAVIGQQSGRSYNGNGGSFQRKQVQAVKGHIFHFNFDVDFLAVVVCFADTGNRHAFLLKGFHHLHPSQILNGTFHHIILRLLMDRRVLVAACLQQMEE